MELGDQILENKWVRLEKPPLTDKLREFIRTPDLLESLWEWMPRLTARGLTYDAYFDYAMAKTKAGEMIPYFATSRIDKTFCGGASYMRVNRTHRSVQIGYMWSPKQVRGSDLPLAVQAAMLRAACNWRARRVYWIVDVMNKPMMSFAANKIGAKKEGEFESYARMNDGRWCDAAVFALVGDGLHDAAERIEARLEETLPFTD